jgi:predicted ribosome quality control (RQC) complex YloA/Tae2 family protein
MFKNFFLLNRQVIEVNRLITGCTLNTVFTQEKDKLIFNLQIDLLEYFIEVNTDISHPYFIIKEKYSRAKKNTLNFFEKHLPSKLFSVKIAEFERVIQFNIEKASIYFYIRGKDTNVFFIDGFGNFESFKKCQDTQKYIDEMKNLNFGNSFLIPKIKIDTAHNISASLLQNYPYLGKEILDEFKFRSESNSTSESEIILRSIISEIEHAKPLVYEDRLSGKYKLSFFHRSDLKSKNSAIFDNVNDALKHFLMKEHQNELKNHTNRDVGNKLEKKIIQATKKRDNIQLRINKGCREKEYREMANLLQLNIDKIARSMVKVELENIYDSNKIISIDLNPRLTIREMIIYYFDKAKSERIAFDKLKILLADKDEEIIKLKATFSVVQDNNSIQKLPHLSSEVKHKHGDKKSLTDSKSKFRQFILHNKYLIYVGKNSKNNDELTTSFAKQNDYWFHARSVSGSHVVLKYEKSMGEIQKNILEKAASIAAFYSKAKTSGLVPVSYTQKKYVIKRKGMEAGKVALLKEKVLIVRPEIPKECRMVHEE